MYRKIDRKKAVLESTKKTLVQVFSRQFCKNFRNSVFVGTLWVTASVSSYINSHISGICRIDIIKYY